MIPSNKTTFFIDQVIAPTRWTQSIADTLQNTTAFKNFRNSKNVTVLQHDEIVMLMLAVIEDGEFTPREKKLIQATKTYLMDDSGRNLWNHLVHQVNGLQRVHNLAIPTGEEAIRQVLISSLEKPELIVNHVASLHVQSTSKLVQQVKPAIPASLPKKQKELFERQVWPEIIAGLEFWDKAGISIPGEVKIILGLPDGEKPTRRDCTTVFGRHFYTELQELALLINTNNNWQIVEKAILQFSINYPGTLGKLSPFEPILETSKPYFIKMIENIKSGEKNVLPSPGEGYCLLNILRKDKMPHAYVILGNASSQDNPFQSETTEKLPLKDAIFLDPHVVLHELGHGFQYFLCPELLQLETKFPDSLGFFGYAKEMLSDVFGHLYDGSMKHIFWHNPDSSKWEPRRNFKVIDQPLFHDIVNSDFYENSELHESTTAILHTILGFAHKHPELRDKIAQGFVLGMKSGVQAMIVVFEKLYQLGVRFTNPPTIEHKMISALLTSILARQLLISITDLVPGFKATHDELLGGSIEQIEMLQTKVQNFVTVKLSNGHTLKSDSGKKVSTNKYGDITIEGFGTFYQSMLTSNPEKIHAIFQNNSSEEQFEALKKSLDIDKLYLYWITNEGSSKYLISDLEGNIIMYENGQKVDSIDLRNI